MWFCWTPLPLLTCHEPKYNHILVHLVTNMAMGAVQSTSKTKAIKLFVYSNIQQQLHLLFIHSLSWQLPNGLEV
jgi:hypothetical protein